MKQTYSIMKKKRMKWYCLILTGTRSLMKMLMAHVLRHMSEKLACFPCEESSLYVLKRHIDLSNALMQTLINWTFIDKWCIISCFHISSLKWSIFLQIHEYYVWQTDSCSNVVAGYTGELRCACSWYKQCILLCYTSNWSSHLQTITQCSMVSENLLPAILLLPHFLPFTAL